ncbi:translocation/assembly module TamB domain-containing protein [Flammeovirga agarivorans]|uniref:Translocation and assembly module TamB C-terminal domain-containing protein n=1 Tax=Flammeovirga agarivorans TaxID=2726742 RepID=A0A7X8XWM2_9BACT|nr:translocation/assembly module TamB domain-containing protein [Flammeovirga agarivorans]NLR92432.1 hypothetical protein [Flammeovirga agarivorans]
MKGSVKRLFLGILILFVLLICFVYGILRVPYVQNIVVTKATEFLSTKTNSKVSIDYIALNFPKSLVIDGILLKHPNGNDFVKLDEILLDVDLETASMDRVVIDDFEVNGLETNIYVYKNGKFNFDYILDSFSSDDSTVVVEEDTTSSVIPPIILNQISLKNIHLLYSDSVQMMTAKLNLGELTASIPNINLNTSEYKIGEVALKKSDISYEVFGQTTSNIVEETDTTEIAEEVPFDLVLKSLSIENTKLVYHDKPLKESAHLSIGHFLVEDHHFNLIDQKVAVGLFKLDETSIRYDLVSDTTIKHEDITNITPLLKPISSLDLGWDVNIDDVQVDQLSLEFNDDLYERLEQGVDPNHILLSKLQLKSKDIKVQDTGITIDLEHFEGKEKSGVFVRSFSSYVFVGPQKIDLTELLLEINNSFLLTDLHLRFSNLYLIGDYIEDLQIDNNLKRSHISFKDALIFDPSLKQDSTVAPYLDYNIDGKLKVKGTVEDMRVSDAKINSDLGIETDLVLHLQDLLSEDSLRYEVSIDSLNFFTKTLLDLNVDQETLNAFNIPQHILGQLHVKGGLKDVSSEMSLSLENFGAFDLDFSLFNEDEYQLKTNTYNLNVGKILKDTTIGKVSTYLTAVGKGFDVEKDLKTLATFDLKKAEYNNYDYGGLKVNLDVDRMAVKWDAKTNSKGAKFNLNGNVDMNSDIPYASVIGDIEHIDFNQLNFLEDTATIGMSIDSETKGFDITNLNTTLDIKDLYYFDGTKKYKYDYVKLHAELDSTHIAGALSAPHLEGDMQADIPLDSLAVVLERYFSQYISSREMIGQLPPSKGKMYGSLKLTDSELLTNGAIEDLDSLQISQFDFNFDAATNIFDFDILVPRVTYSDIDVDSTFVSIHADGKKMAYKLGFERLRMLGYEDYAVHNWEFGGEAHDNVLTFKTVGQNEDFTKKWLLASANLTLDSTTYRFKLDDPLIVNDEKWNVNTNNYILSDGGLPYIHELTLEQKGQKFNFFSSQFDEQDTVYKFEVIDYSLDDITYNVTTDTSLVNGLVNADIEIGDISQGGKLSADFKIEDFGILNHILATLTSNAKNTDDINVYESNARIVGPIGNIHSESSFNVADTIAPLDLSLTIDSLLIHPFEALSSEYLSDLNGGFSGGLKVKGGGVGPLDIKGAIKMQEPTFKVKMFNLKLAGTDGQMIFDDKGMHFENFGFKDENGRYALLAGNIYTTDYTDMDFNLKFSADDITVINSTSKDNPEYFGKLIVGNITKINGPIDHLMIDSEIRIARGTDLTYVYMDGGIAEIDTGDDIIEFVQEDDTITIAKSTHNYELKTTINIDDKSSFKVVIDPRAGDALTLVGGGVLHLRMDAGGDLVMSGQYEVTEGDYSMTFYQLMNKKLSLKKGSTVLWTGDPYNPQANMTAIYQTSTSPYPLVANQISPSESNKYKAKRNFIVYMNMRGDVIKPELSFELEYPEGSQGGDKIESAIEYLNQDESQLNKQVFSLLILGTFLNDAGGDGANTQDMVTGSVSSIISQQLNNVTNNLTNGFVDVDFDVDSYSQQQTSGGSSNRTDVGVTLKKSLFKDRLSVSVGGKVAVNGNEANNNSSTFNTDFLLEYNLLTDGTLKNRLFRSIDAQYFTPDVFKTGVSIVFTKDYNHGRELFIRNLDKKKDIRKRMGMIKRSNTGGGMMEASSDSSSNSGGMQPAKSQGMAPAKSDSTQQKADSTKVEIDSTSIKTTPSDSLKMDDSESRIPVEEGEEIGYVNSQLFYQKEKELKRLLSENED